MPGDDTLKGMYCVKYKVHKKADSGGLSINTSSNPKMVDPYGKKLGRQLSDDRYRGKQFAVAAGASKPFSTVYPLPTGYQEKISYRKVERKKGFGSGDAPKRDEFSTGIAVEQYREAIRSEIKTAKAAAIRMLEKEGISEEQAAAAIAAAQAKRGEPEEKQEVFLFDQVFKVEVDEQVGKARLGHKLMNLGAARTTTSEYGKGCSMPKVDGKNGRYSVTSGFFNSGHLGLAED